MAENEKDKGLETKKNEHETVEKGGFKKFLHIVTTPIRVISKAGKTVAEFAKEHPKSALTLAATIGGVAGYAGKGAVDMMRKKSYTAPIPIGYEDVPEIDIPEIPEAPEISEPMTVEAEEE